MLGSYHVPLHEDNADARGLASAVEVLGPAAALAGALLLAACGADSVSEPPSQAAVDTVMLSRTAAFITVAGRVQLTATPQSLSGYRVSDATVTWRSAGPAATVSAEGLVTGVAAGTVSIVATSRGRSSIAVISVVNAAPGDTVLFPNPGTLALAQSHALQLLSFDGAGLANAQTGAQGSWTTSDASVAKVGSEGKVTAAGAGTVSIGVTFGGTTRSTIVTVVEFSAIAPGLGAVCAITTTGALYCSGKGYGPWARPVAAGLRFRSLSGVENFCAVSLDDLAYCWFPGTELRVDLQTRDPTLEPILVSASLKFQVVSAGETFMNCGVTEAGEGYCWGVPHINNGFRASTTPAGLTITEPLSQIQPGCALTTGGKVYCWGIDGGVGALGTGVAGGDEEWSPPAPVNSNVQFTAVCWGACALGPVGDPYQWGYVGQGRGADTCRGRANACNFSPAPVASNRRFTHVTGAGRGRCGVTEAEEIACWGINDYDVLGIASSETPACPGAALGTGAPPCIAEPTITLRGFRSIAGGLRNLCGIARSGVALCWGSNESAQLTDPSVVTSTPKPTLFSIDPTR